MANTSFGVNDASAVKTWATELSIAARDTLEIRPLIGEDENAIIHLKTETRKSPGDRVRFSLLARLQGDGFTEGESALGNAEAMSLFTDDILINELGNTVAPPSDATIDSQRVVHKLRDKAKPLLGLWFADRMAKWFFTQACGYTPEARPKYYGFNAPTAPTSTRQVWAGTAANDQSLTSSDTFTLDLLLKAREKASVGESRVRPLRLKGGQDVYVAYLHDYQIRTLKSNFSTGQWGDIQKAAMQGGMVEKNPIFQGSLGMYDNIILRRSQDVTQGVNASSGAAISTVRRAVLLGAQSCCIAFGQNNGPTKYRWTEELDDHGRKLEVGGWAIAGMKKTVFANGASGANVDFGTVVISTYAVAA